MGELTTEDLPWLSDYIFYIFKSPSWAVPIANFVDERCIIFDDEEENKFEYTSCHNEFKTLVDDLLAAHLLELSITPEQFEHFCRTGLPAQCQLHTILVEQLLGVEDFLMFKAMMTKRNMDLFREALSRMEAEKQEVERLRQEFGVVAPEPAAAEPCPASPAPEGGAHDSGASGGDDEWKLYEDQVTQVLKSSEEEAEHLELQKKCEEAELERVIALSLQAEEERIRQMAEEEEEHIQQACMVSCAMPAEQLAPVEGCEPTAAAACDVSEPQPMVYAAYVEHMPPAAAMPVVPDFSGMPAVVPALVPAPTEPEQTPDASFASEPVPTPLPEEQPPVAPQEREIAPSAAPPPAPPPPPALPRIVRLEPLAAKPAGLPTLPALLPNPTGSFHVEQKKYETAVQRARAENLVAAATAKNFTVAATLPPQLSEPGCPSLPVPPNVPPPPSGPTEEEKRQRAEHLKRHRQMLLEKKSQERARQLGEFNQNRGRTNRDAAAVPPPPPPVANGRGLAAELAAIPPPGPTEQQQVEEAQAAAKQMRQALTMQLRQTLTKQMPNAGANMDEQLAQLEQLRLH